jgi:lysyl-tRNA synthetase class 2
MRFYVDDRIFSEFPGVSLGVVVIKGGNNAGDHKEISSNLKEEQTAAVQKLGNTKISEHPKILPWRAAYRKFGAKPSDYLCSIENLVKRVQKGEQIRHINNLVDIYNIVSLRYLVPVGGEDLDKTQGDIALTFAGENEQPAQLLGEPEPRAPHKGEVIYKDDKGAICRRWNWKEADRTKLTEQTTNALLVIEALPPTTREELQTATSALRDLVEKYCGGFVNSYILDENKREIRV